MNRIIDFALNNKLAIWILSIIVIFAGLYAGLTMKQETMPDIDLPNVSIVTTYPGAAPDVVAKDVTTPIEDRLQHLDHVEVVTSSSFANASSIQMQFDYGTDMDKAMMEINEALDKIDLPEQVNDSEVTRISFNEFPVMSISLSDDNDSLESLTSTIESNVLPQLEGIPGVQEAQITGEQLEEVTLTFKEKELDKYNLDEETVMKVVQGTDVTFPLGLTSFKDDVKNVVVDGNIASMDDLKKIKIPYSPVEAGQELPTDGEMDMQAMDPSLLAEQPMEQPTEMPTVTLEKIADIDVEKSVDSISRTNGQESIGVQIVKTPDANTVDVVNDTKESIEALSEEYGFTSVTTFDQGEPIEDSVEMMLEKAIFGIIFAVIVILIFLRNFRTTLISVVSIPLSLLIALFLLNQMDITLNILTLGALTVAIGRVIDDSIVVMENIYRRMTRENEPLKGKELIREATKQMFVPIFSSTVVTIVVFLPLVLVGGMVGELFLPFALAVVFALAASLVVAVTIVPMLAHSLFKKRLNTTEKENEQQGEKERGKITTLYKNILNWALNHKLVTFGGATIVLIASLFLIPVIGASFLPDDEQNVAMITYSPEAGQTKDATENIVFDAEETIDAKKGIKMYQYSIGGNPMGAMAGMNDDNSALFFIEYDKDFKYFSEESTRLVEQLNDETDTGEWASLDFANMDSNMELYVYGDETKDIEQASTEILSLLEKEKDLDQAESSLSEAYDQYTLVVNQEKLNKHGLTAAQIGMALSNMNEADVLTTVTKDDKELNVVIPVEEKEYDKIKDMTKVTLETPLGTEVKIADVVDVEEGKSPETIQHRDGKMYASITADILTKDVAGISADVEKEIDKLDLPDGVNITFGGVTEQINESFTQLGLAMLAAIAIVYFVLVVTFGGALAPLSILFSLPFTIIGSLVALWIFSEPLSVSAMIGGLMLIGIVVTNAIVLIDRVIRNEESGLTIREAIIEAGQTRLRPILMTALATIGALIPLLFGMEGGGLISKGLGITVIGGLTSSTLLTLVIVPIVYEFFAKFKRKENKA
ncbi:MAG TPA: efflux RND transporter permease subunit [Bacillota bacterium]|nr:efflux RND transporter permease subunit [Bacillota bacterium]